MAELYSEPNSKFKSFSFPSSPWCIRRTCCFKERAGERHLFYHLCTLDSVSTLHFCSIRDRDCLHLILLPFAHLFPLNYSELSVLTFLTGPQQMAKTSDLHLKNRKCSTLNYHHYYFPFSAPPVRGLFLSVRDTS